MEREIVQVRCLTNSYPGRQAWPVLVTRKAFSQMRT